MSVMVAVAIQGTPATAAVVDPVMPRWARSPGTSVKPGTVTMILAAVLGLTGKRTEAASLSLSPLVVETWTVHPVLEAVKNWRAKMVAPEDKSWGILV